MIILAHQSMIELLPDFAKPCAQTIGNGVDCKYFHEKRPILLYTGIISEWVDIELLEQISKAFPFATLRLIGPETADTQNLRRNFNVQIFKPIPYELLADQINHANVCLAPFRQGNKRYAANSGKIFQYFAAGKPVVTIGRPLTEFEKSTDRASYAADDPGDFLQKIVYALRENDKELENKRIAYARSCDWDLKAQEFVKMITGVVNSCGY